MKYQHDAVGRISASEQRTPLSANPYRFTYAYYANDSVATTTYPSLKAITTCYDGLGRAIWVSKTKIQSDCVNGTALASADGYATGAVYAPHGALAGLQFGNGLVETTDYNVRQQPDWVALGTGTPSTSNGSVFYESYSYGTQNNGNIQQVTMRLPGGTNVNRMLAYDKANRLQAAMEDGGALPASAPFCPAGNTGRWCQAFSYDERGDRTVTETGLGTNPVNIVSFATTNRIADAGWEYDGRGNIQAAPLNTGSTPKDRYLFDAEDRLRVACPSAGASEMCNNDTPSAGRVLYDYDAEGRRVRRSGAAVSEVVYVYDLAGQLTAEYGGDTQSTSGVKYLTTDYLGSTRVLADANTNAVGRYDYLPFGESLGVSSGNPRFGIAGYGPVDQSVRLRFTGKERDVETGLDFFGARYFSGAQGRFTSPDGSGVDQHPGDPRSLNLYVYARNNPLRFVDPTGQRIQVLGSAQDREDTRAALCAELGDEACKQLSIQSSTASNGTVSYYLAVADDQSFSNLGQAEADLAGLIRDPGLVQFAWSDPNGDRFDEGRFQLSSLQPGGTGIINGMVSVRVTREAPITLPGDMTSSGQPLPSTTGDVIMHEFGHAAAAIGAVFTPPTSFPGLFGLGRIPNPAYYEVFDRAAVNWENAARRARNPRTATRIKHNRYGKPFGRD